MCLKSIFEPGARLLDPVVLGPTSQYFGAAGRGQPPSFGAGCSRGLHRPFGIPWRPSIDLLTRQKTGRMTSCGGSSPGRTPRGGSMKPVYLLGLSEGYFVVYDRSLENKSKF